MENQKRSAAVTSTATPAAVVTARPTATWLVSAPFDLCFLANLWWLPVVLVGILAGETDSWYGFWQIYFVTAPHRWLTLFLVVADPDRRAGRTSWLIGLAIVSALVVGGVWWTTGQLLCLALADYLWNAWHFGSQHGGIARMYARRAGVTSSPAQTWSLRLLTFYTAVRVAGWSTGWIEAQETLAIVLAVVDLVVMSIAAVAAIAALWRGQNTRGWTIYTLSVLGVYAAILVSVNLRAHVVTSALVAASAGMHAIEYLAIVTFYARRREHSGSAGLFQSVARQWTWLLLIYLILLGSLTQITEQRWLMLATAVNTFVAFLHYAYDGMIWKLRDAKTSQALNVQIASAAGGKP